MIKKFKVIFLKFIIYSVLIALLLWIFFIVYQKVIVLLPKQNKKPTIQNPITSPVEIIILKQPEMKLPKTLPTHIKEANLKVLKSKRQLLLYSGKKLLRRYPIALGFSPVKDKIKEGDGATPEGEFYIFTKNPQSAYYLSLGISYPNIQDAKQGLKAGLITQGQYQQIIYANQRKTTPPQNTALGGLIYIHGHGSKRDWTQGCVALDDDKMKELFNVIEVGTPVVIAP